METRRVIGVAHNTQFLKAGIDMPGGWPVPGKPGRVWRHLASLSCWCRPELQYLDIPIADEPDDPYVTA